MVTISNFAVVAVFNNFDVVAVLTVLFMLLTTNVITNFVVVVAGNSFM